MTAEPRDRSPEHAEPSRFIPHVQGLRAIAVLAVVLYHFWPARFSGGYVGVDIFFVISGFLITSHLMRELTATGTLRLGQFWARRARRLLPASLLVLLFCALVAMSPYLTPTSALPNEVREILASTFYVENWYLALNSADYLNHSGDPTTVQHYWSLSLEEQFYVMWPLLMLLAAWIGVKWFRGARRRAVITTLAVVSVISFVFCVVFTMTNPAPAYFVTFGRMWQFGVGAMVALVPMLRIRNAIGSFVLGWAGIAVLVFVIFRFDGQTPFPGYAAALPTLGRGGRDHGLEPRALVVPDAGARDPPRAVRRQHLVLALPVALAAHHHRAVGAVLGADDLPPPRAARAVLRARLADEAVRRGPRAQLEGAHLAARPRHAVVVARRDARRRRASPAPRGRSTRRRTAPVCRRSQDLRENPPPCFGAAVVLDRSCAGTDFGDTILPAPGFAGVDRPTNPECFVQLNDARPVSCTFGSDDPGAPRVALIGDSHAYQLLSTFQAMADENGWQLVTYFKGACPWNTTPLATPGAFGAACTQWRDSVTAELEDADLDAVFTAALATTPYSSDGYPSAHDAAVAGYREAWSEMLDRGIPVITVVDNPVWETDPNKCLRTHAHEPSATASGRRCSWRTIRCGTRHPVSIARRCSTSPTSSAAPSCAARWSAARTSTATRTT